MLSEFFSIIFLVVGCAAFYYCEQKQISLFYSAIIGLVLGVAYHIGVVVEQMSQDPKFEYGYDDLRWLGVWLAIGVVWMITPSIKRYIISRDY